MRIQTKDIDRLSPAAQRQILEKTLKAQGGGSIKEIMREAERVGIRFTIPLNPVTKKNSSRVVPCGRYHKVLPSEAYEKYEERAGEHIPYKGLMIDRPCEIKCLFYTRIDHSQSKNSVDLTNLLEAIDDTLVAHHLLADDNCRIIVSHDGSRVLHDKARPRTEVTIRFMQKRRSAMSELSMTVEEYMKKYPLPEECSDHITPQEWALMCAASEYIDEELPVPETPEGEEGSYLKYSSRVVPKGDRSTPLKRARDRLYYEFMEEHAAEFGVTR